MGCNFYAYHEDTREELHIGKSSYGWYFALRIYPERGITNLDHWKGILPKFSKVYDEDGKKISLPDLWDRIENRPEEWASHTPDKNILRGEGTYDYFNVEFS